VSDNVEYRIKDLLLFLPAVFVIGILSGGTAAVIGFGIGSLLTPLLTLRLGASLAVVAVAIPHLLATAVRFTRHASAVDWPTFRRFGIWSAVGGLAGALWQARLTGPILLAALGVLLVATGLTNVTSGFGDWRPSPRLAPALGLASGLFGGLVGNQGGLRATGLLAFELAPRAFLATSTAVALIVDLVRTPVYLVRGGSMLTGIAVPITVASVGCLIGTVLGERVLLGLPPALYRRLVGAGVGLIGIWLLARAL
jgi:uncharacterized membrane protein YfcA